jgi:dihydroorotate dehydrogenase
MPEIFRALRALWFKLDPEYSQRITLAVLGAVGKTHPFDQYLAENFRGKLPLCPVRVMGIDFPNPVGLAAGLDKNACAVDGLGAFGFGFLELGTVTPLPQTGNPRKRLFRFIKEEALINRMGFNNAGLNEFLNNLSHRRGQVRIGISIGKNTDVPVEEAMRDYRTCLRAVYTIADYVSVDISSPNTAGLLELHTEPLLSQIFQQLKDEQDQLAQQHSLYTPIAIKISPDLDKQDIERIANALMTFELDGVIATNTTRLRHGVITGTQLAGTEGGLSGRPLLTPSTEIVRQLYQHLSGGVPIIGCGGIFDPEDAWSKLSAGASMVQLYTGFAYHGPALVRRIVEDLAGRAGDSGSGELTAILAAAHARIATPNPHEAIISSNARGKSSAPHRNH